MPQIKGDQPADMNRASKRGCAWALAVGCSAVVLIVVILLVALVLNWKRIESKLESTLDSAEQTVAELEVVRVALQAKYPTAQVGVTTKRQIGLSGAILSVRLVVAEAEADGGQWGKAKALEVALAARAALSPEREYDIYEILLATHQKIIGFNVTKTTAFVFRTRELPSRPGETSDRAPTS